MSIEPVAQPRIRRLDIRVRRVRSSDGEDTVDLGVYCAYKGKSISLNECALCESCRTISIDPRERESFLICARSDRPNSAAAREHIHRYQVPSVGDPAFAAKTTQVSAVMTRNVICVAEDVEIESVLEYLLSRQLTAVPVVDAAGHPVGILSKTDLLNELYQRGDTREVEGVRIQTRDGYELELGNGFHVEGMRRTQASEVMTPLVFSVPETATLAEASALMAYEGVHRLVVVGPDNAIVGIISSMDVLRWVARQSGYLFPMGPGDE